jgi:hypothetical protein
LEHLKKTGLLGTIDSSAFPRKTKQSTIDQVRQSLQYKIIDAVNIEFRGLEPRGYRPKQNALEPSSSEGVRLASGELETF